VNGKVLSSAFLQKLKGLLTDKGRPNLPPTHCLAMRRSLVGKTIVGTETYPHSSISFLTHTHLEGVSLAFAGVGRGTERLLRERVQAKVG
jgi:hypothetical protein